MVQKLSFTSSDTEASCQGAETATERFWLIWEVQIRLGKGLIHGRPEKYFTYLQGWAFFLKLHVFIVCVFVSVYECMHVVQLAGAASLLLSWVLGSRQAGVVRFGDKCYYPLSHLIDQRGIL